jgi:hypothetical protein
VATLKKQKRKQKTSRAGVAGLQHGDMLTEREATYILELEKLWDMLSDTVEGGRLTEADIPDDYQALVSQMVKLAGIEGAKDPELEE